MLVILEFTQMGTWEFIWRFVLIKETISRCLLQRRMSVFDTHTKYYISIISNSHCPPPHELCRKQLKNSKRDCLIKGNGHHTFSVEYIMPDHILRTSTRWQHYPSLESVRPVFPQTPVLTQVGVVERTLSVTIYEILKWRIFSSSVEMVRVYRWLSWVCLIETKSVL